MKEATDIRLAIHHEVECASLYKLAIHPERLLLRFTRRCD